LIESQLFEYDCPTLTETFDVPDYSDPAIKNSLKPDYRHTLYWNPFVKPENDKSATVSFYTSDLNGEFEIIVEGITSEGKMLCGYSRFQVK
jgi:hypothetical protein